VALLYKAASIGRPSICLPARFVSKGFVVETCCTGLVGGGVDTVFDLDRAVGSPVMLLDLHELSEVYECDRERVPAGTER